MRDPLPSAGLRRPLPRSGLARFAAALPLSFFLAASGRGAEPGVPEARRKALARNVVEYFEEMSAPKPLAIRSGEEFEAHRRELRKRILSSIGLSPFPDKVPLEPRETPALEHPWCLVKRIYYQIWPGVFSDGLLYLPREPASPRAPAILSPHGHWASGNAHPIVQTRCLVFAKLGYVVFSPRQQHYEDLAIGISHQTISVWSNIRALDYLESRSDVDPARIGVCGASGGGLQTQMLCAVDPRPAAAAIVGMTCEFREILFPYASHCVCNHFPGVLRFADGPELSALGLPRPVLYLTMDDWTKRFVDANFPAIRALYEANGAPGRVAAVYEPTEHTFDRSKRERAYRWMETWLRGRAVSAGPLEPEEVATFPPERLAALSLEVPGHNEFERVSRIYEKERIRPPPRIESREAWELWRREMLAGLREILGAEAALPKRSAAPDVLAAREAEGIIVERLDLPSEGPVRVPAVILRPKAARGRLPVVLILDGRGKEAALSEEGPAGAFSLAREGHLAAALDARFFGELSFEALGEEIGPELSTFRPASPLGKAASAPGKAAQTRTAWERNAIVFGRPIAAMAATDLLAALDAILSRPDADPARVSVVGRGSGEAAAAVLFAAALEPRIASAEVDLEGRSFRARSLALVPSVLLHGDVFEWAALLADRKLALRRAPDGDLSWLEGVFEKLGNRSGLEVSPCSAAKTPAHEETSE